MNFETLPRVSKTKTKKNKTLKTFAPRVCKMRKTRDDGKINEREGNSGKCTKCKNSKIPKEGELSLKTTGNCEELHSFIIIYHQAKDIMGSYDWGRENYARYTTITIFSP